MAVIGGRERHDNVDMGEGGVRRRRLEEGVGPSGCLGLNLSHGLKYLVPIVDCWPIHMDRAATHQPVREEPNNPAIFAHKSLTIYLLGSFLISM